MERYYYPDLRKIEKKLIEKGWSLTKLSEESPLSQRTIDSIMAGGRILRSTLKKLAEALGIKNPFDLLSDSTSQYTESPLQKMKKKVFVFAFEYDIPFSQFDETKDFNTLLRKIQSIIDETNSIDPSAKEGTTIISVSINGADIVPLLRAYLDGKFDMIKVFSGSFALSAIIIPAEIRDNRIDFNRDSHPIRIEPNSREHKILAKELGATDEEEVLKE